MDLSVLCISHLYAVVENTHLLRAHRAYVDGFQSTYAAVVFYLYPREISDGIGNRLRIKALQCNARQTSWRDYFGYVFFAHNLELFDIVGLRYCVFYCLL